MGSISESIPPLNARPSTDINHVYETSEQYHSQPSHLRVICVGAGAAGLCLAYKMKHMKFTNYDLICYEKNSGVAGTWFENRYPGCSCDVPAHSYTFSFEPKPDWSTFYAYAPEIKSYFEGFAKKHDLMPNVKLNSKVKSTTWIEDEGKYNVEVDVNGETVQDWCHILVNGTGFLNDWKWPKIEGLHSFEGHLMHTANWDTTVDWTGKRVAVIGTGSSAIQTVPQVQKTASHLTTFMRSVTWISPPVGGNILEAERHAAGEDQEANNSKVPHAQHYYTSEEIARFKTDPEYHLQYRRNLEGSVNKLFDMFIHNSAASKGAEQLMRAEMNRRIGPGHEELKQKLIPSWPPGCRRITPGDGYLEALVQPNVTCVHSEITRILPNGIQDATGTIHEVDIIACATGFNLAFSPPFALYGVNGLSMQDFFAPSPQVYLSVSVPHFPNYFIVNGVRGQWAAGTALPAHEVCVEYILTCARRLQTENIRALEVKMEPVRQLYEHIDAWHKRSVWNADCKSWYKGNVKGGKLWIWGGSALHYMKTLRGGVRWEHYDVRYLEKNMWAFLGNGRVEAEVKVGKGEVNGEEEVNRRLAPYLRNSDVEFEI